MDTLLRFVLRVAGKPFGGCSIPIYHGTYIQVQPLSRSASCPRSCRDQWFFTLRSPITQQSERHQQGKNWSSFYRWMGKPCSAHCGGRLSSLQPSRQGKAAYSMCEGRLQQLKVEHRSRERQRNLC